MTETERILVRSLDLACQFIRKYPCVELEAYTNNNMMQELAGGRERDPLGTEFFNKFLDMAIEGKKIK